MERNSIISIKYGQEQTTKKSLSKVPGVVSKIKIQLIQPFTVCSFSTPGYSNIKFEFPFICKFFILHC